MSRSKPFDFSGKAVVSRRSVARSVAAAGAALALSPVLPGFLRADPSPPHLRAIPSSGEKIPAIGMGSWITFNVGPIPALRDARVSVLQTFFDMGGGMVDSSPMYGTSEEVIGYCLGKIENDKNLFSATKVWTVSKAMGIRQMEQSEQLWGLKKFDLMQIHNLLDWNVHLKTLVKWKAEGRIRYIGITTSHGRRHDDIEALMKSLPLDFVQFTYNILDREVEERLLPLAAEKGIAVICNRPFQRGALFDKFQQQPLPRWATEIYCANWAQFFLKFIISHPAVTCAIPATSQVVHMTENMGALSGRLPDMKTRERMAAFVESL